METGITKTEAGGLALADRVRDYIADSVADNTKRGYASDWRTFCAWCEDRGWTPLPATPATVAAYFSDMADAGKKSSTISRARAAIHMAHETAGAAGSANPTTHKAVAQTLKGIRRKLGTARTKKAPILADDIRAMLKTLPDGLLGVRDRALLLVGFAGAFRRSELAGLAVDCLEYTAEGVKILLPKSKTDQDGQGRYVGIKRGSTPATCPVRALESWTKAAGITEGPVFRSVDRHGRVGAAISSQSIALVVKRAATAAGLDAAKYSGHSLRAGFVTQGAVNGASEANIMRQTGHTSSDTVRGYIRIANIFRDNVSGMLGL